MKSKYTLFNSYFVFMKMKSAIASKLPCKSLSLLCLDVISSKIYAVALF